MTRIAFFDTKPYDKEIFDAHNQHYGFEFKYFKSHLNPDTAVMTQGYEVVCAFVNDILNAQVVDTLYNTGIQLIALRSAGYNNVDIKAAANRIKIVRVPAYSPYAVAEHTVALMLTLNRKIHRAYYRTRDANFALSGLMGFDMHGKTCGVVGTGKIGKVLITILRGFGMQVLAQDPYPDEDFARQTGAEYTTLEEVIRRSDIISLNCPLTKETEYLINRETIAQMKPGVMIINTGRGKLIRTKDLIDGLKKGQIGAAGLDVYEEEGDYFFEDLSDRILTDDVLARLLSFNNVIITSHQAFFTREALNNIAETTLENIAQWAKGKSLTNEVCYKCPGV